MSPSLKQAQSRSIGELSLLSGADLMSIQKEAAELLSQTKSLKEWIDGAIALKYEPRARYLRQKFERDTGTIHFEDDDIRVTSELAKKTLWDQQKLAKIAEKLIASGDDPSDFIDVTYRVSERKYSAWPRSLQKSFESARTLKTGKPLYRLETLSEKK